MERNKAHSELLLPLTHTPIAHKTLKRCTAVSLLQKFRPPPLGRTDKLVPGKKALLRSRGNCQGEVYNLASKELQMQDTLQYSLHVRTEPNLLALP
jgi:hypothetical protein